MIEIEISTNLEESEPKLALGLTTRQLICAVLGLGCAVLTFIAAGKVLGDTDARLFFPMVTIVPFALVGFIKPYGLRFEKFAWIILNTYILPPKNRKYKTVNIYEQVEKMIEEEENPQVKSKKQQKKKKSKNLKIKGMRGIE